MKVILKNTQLVFQSSAPTEPVDPSKYYDSSVYPVEVENPEFDKVITDSDDKLLWSEKDGVSKYYDTKSQIGDEGYTVKNVVDAVRADLNW